MPQPPLLAGLRLPAVFLKLRLPALRLTIYSCLDASRSPKLSSLRFFLSRGAAANSCHDRIMPSRAGNPAHASRLEATKTKHDNNPNSASRSVFAFKSEVFWCLAVGFAPEPSKPRATKNSRPDLFGHIINQRKYVHSNSKNCQPVRGLLIGVGCGFLWGLPRRGA